MLKLSIITPTLLRDSLKRTCDSIDRQSYTTWEHIVMMDTREERPDLIESIEHPNRRIYRCPEPHRNYGNTCRHNAWKKCRGDYIGYIDDDDYFVDGAFQRIVDALGETRPDSVVFPAQRFEEKFFNIPPASCMTVTGQYLHRPYIKGKFARWPRVAIGDTDYLVDGKFVDQLRELGEFKAICEEVSLVVIEGISNGKV